VPIDRDKLAKILSMTTSDKDGEVLAAMALANAMLKKENTTWGDIFKDAAKNVTIEIFAERPYKAEASEGSWVAPHLKDKITIGVMFRAVFSQPRSGSEDFWRQMDDLHNKFEKFGVLTVTQYNLLRKVYQRAIQTK
jgi:hypothetical protein